MHNLTPSKPSSTTKPERRESSATTTTTATRTTRTTARTRRATPFSLSTYTAIGQNNVGKCCCSLLSNTNDQRLVNWSQFITFLFPAQRRSTPALEKRRPHSNRNCGMRATTSALFLQVETRVTAAQKRAPRRKEDASRRAEWESTSKLRHRPAPCPTCLCAGPQLRPLQIDALWRPCPF